MILTDCAACAAPLAHNAPRCVRCQAELSTLRRFGGSEKDILAVQNNLACTYDELGRPEVLQMNRDVYNGYLKLHGEEHVNTLRATNNYALCLVDLQRYEEAKPLLRKTIPVARRVLGDSNEFTLRMRLNYAGALCRDAGATVDDLRKAVMMLEESEPIARRVLGSAHPLVAGIERVLLCAREVLRRRETPSSSSGSA